MRLNAEPKPPNLTRKRLARDAELGWNSIPEVQTLQNTLGRESIYFIGDSFTQDVRWTGNAIELLNGMDLPLNGFSLGVSGFGTTQAQLKLQRHFDEHKPALVILLFFAWNDLRDNLRYPGIYYNLETRARPYLVREDGGAFKLRKPWILPDLILYSRSYERLMLIPAIEAADQARAKFGIDWIAEQRLPLLLTYTDGLSWDPFYRQSRQGDAYVSEAWSVTVEALRRLNEYVTGRGSKFLLIGVDNAFTVDEDVLAAWVTDRQGFDADLPLTRLGEVAAQLHIPYINALPSLRELRRLLGRKLYKGPEGNLSGHFEAEAERLIGELAAGRARQLLRGVQ